MVFSNGGLWDVFFDSPTDGWSVGDSGTILHYNGISWSVFPSPTTDDLRSVYMLNSADGWIVGKGAILHFNGVSWQSVPLPNGKQSFCLKGDCVNQWRYVYFLNDNDGWAVGEESTTAHWNGVQWTFIPNPLSQTECPNAAGKLIPIAFRGVFMSASNDVWVVGWFGTMMNWNGTAFNLVPTPLPACDVPAVRYPLLNIDSVYMLTPTDGWAVGEPGIVLQWNGSVWTQDPTPTNGMTFRSVQMLSATDVWFAGGGTDTLGGPAFVNWNGSTFTVYRCPPNGYECGEMRSIYMVNATDGWVVGQIQSTQPPSTAPMLQLLPGSFLTMESDPSSGGSVTPSGSTFENSGASVNIQATPNTNYAFLSWSGTGTGSYSGTNNPATVTMNGPITETANFQQTSGQLSVSLTSPKNGATVTSSPVTFKATVTGLVKGATVTVFVDGSQACSGSTTASGSFSCQGTVTETGGTHSWYATASKTGFTSGTSPTWTFTY